MNSLIAYIIYAGITLYRNKRNASRQTVSLQALALTTVYSVIVFLSLFMSDKLYGSVLILKANSIFEEMDTMAALVSKASAFQQKDQDYAINMEIEQKDAEVYYKKASDKDYHLYKKRC